MNLDSILSILTLVSFIIGFLLKSPLATSIPTAAVRILSMLQPEAIDKVVAFIRDQSVRRATAIEYLKKIGMEYDVYIDDAVAGQVLDAIVSLYKHLLSDIQRFKK
jgi:hypothetical protein